MMELNRLIRHYEDRERTCAAEKERCANFDLSSEDVKRMMDVWEEERLIAHDTVAWLSSIPPTT